MSRFTIDLSDEIDARLTEIAVKNGITKAEAMRKAFAILSIAERQKEKGLEIGIIKQAPDHSLQAIGTIVGLWVK